MKYILMEYGECGLQCVNQYNSLESAQLEMAERFSQEAEQIPEFDEDGYWSFDDGSIGPWSAYAYGWEWLIVEVEV